MEQAPGTALCGCCETAGETTVITNRPGLSAVAYRLGTFGSFRAAMLRAIADEPALRALTTRRSDDTAITVLELWSAIADVLTFYQERIANEAFLRTARERDSILRLARLLDYHPRPGLAATTRLAFTLDAGATTRIPVGLRVMSVPGQDEKPQIWETTEAIQADARWNRAKILPVPTATNPFAQGRTEAALVAGPDRLAPGDPLLFYDAGLLEEKQVAALADARIGAEKTLTWTPAIQAGTFAARATHVAKSTRTFRFFGFNAPDTYSVFLPGGTTEPSRWETKPNDFDFPASQTVYPLDARYEDLKTGATLLVDTAIGSEPIRLGTVTKVAQVTATKGLLQDTVTEITLARVLRSAPAVSSWAANRLDVFARGGEDTLLHSWWDGEWHGWQSLAGRITSAPAAVSWGPNRIDVFARGTDLALWHRGFDGSWHSWVSLGGTLTSAPTVSSWGANRLDVFARGTNRALWHRGYDGSWHAWESLGGVLTSAPAAASWGPNRIDVFARGLDGNLWHRWFDGAWHPWHSLKTKVHGTPAVCAHGVGRLEVFDRAEDGQLRHGWFDGAWNGWESLGGSLTTAPGAVSWGPSRIDALGLGADRTLRHIAWTGSAWSAWGTHGFGIGQIDNLRNVRLFQVEAPDLGLRLHDYAATIAGGRVTVPIGELEGIEVGRTVLLRDDQAAPHTAEVTGTETLRIGSADVPDHLAIDFTPALPAPLAADSAILLGNVAEASHGESVRDEMLGDGDASVPFQKFAIRKKPVTYVPSATSPSGESTLQVRVNGEAWTEVDTLFGQPPTAPVYTVRQSDDGTSTAQFGDGVTGARLPSGRGNVVASYRQGLGLEGRARTDQLSIPLDRPVGLSAATNPAPADGGADPEILDQARTSAPTTVKTFGRAISLPDFEILATASGEVARARATWVWRGIEKAVHLTVAGQQGAWFSADALATLHAALTASRDPNHALLIGNVVRVPVVVGVHLHVDERHVTDAVVAAARAALHDFFDPARIGFADPVHLSAIYATVQAVTGVLALEVTQFHYKGFASWTATQLASRGATAEAVQPHLRIFAARPRPAPGAVVDPITASSFGGGPLPLVLPAEQASIAVEPTDLTLTSTGGLA